MCAQWAYTGKIMRKTVAAPHTFQRVCGAALCCFNKSACTARGTAQPFSRLPSTPQSRQDRAVFPARQHCRQVLHLFPPLAQGRHERLRNRTACQSRHYGFLCPLFHKEKAAQLHQSCTAYNPRQSKVSFASFSFPKKRRCLLFFFSKRKVSQNLPPPPPWEAPEDEVWVLLPPEESVSFGRAVRLTVR